RRGSFWLFVLVSRARHRQERSVSTEEIGLMIITKKAIARRTALRRTAPVAFPLLDSMVPAAKALAATPAAPSQRFGFVYVPHGSIMREWTPAQEGAHFEVRDMRRT